MRKDGFKKWKVDEQGTSKASPFDAISENYKMKSNLRDDSSLFGGDPAVKSLKAQEETLKIASFNTMSLLEEAEEGNKIFKRKNFEKRIRLRENSESFAENRFSQNRIVRNGKRSRDLENSSQFGFL
ncbi:hypothetical protein [Leptospira stimsonii]|uniref:hypothetical protein n=1 Tax=Leptospira stimsonii TaxID=2202203 RepID=UPI001430289B|nr:hypothetical protein [Leptospira stimsonii]